MSTIFKFSFICAIVLSFSAIAMAQSTTEVGGLQAAPARHGVRVPQECREPVRRELFTGEDGVNHRVAVGRRVVDAAVERHAERSFPAGRCSSRTTSGPA